MRLSLGFSSRALILSVGARFLGIEHPRVLKADLLGYDF